VLWIKVVFGLIKMLLGDEVPSMGSGTLVILFPPFIIPVLIKGHNVIFITIPLILLLFLV
jgi:hypothetical protein